jgi:hypothetical protein
MQASQGIRSAASKILPIAALALLASPARTWAIAPDETTSTAARLVRQALEAEAAGDRDARGEYLQRALAADPDYAPAHWQMGEVRQDDKWVGIDTLSRDPARKRRMDEYRRKLDMAANTLDGQLMLARYCQRAGLREQELSHYANVFELDPNWIEARKNLNLVDHRGTLMLPSQAAALAAEEQLRDATINQWVPRLVALRKDIIGGQSAAREKALHELQGIRDPEAIPALEAATSLGTPDIGMAVVASLSGIRGQRATDSLVRHAVLARDEDVRQAAIDGLRSRSVYATVPVLLRYLQLPVDIRFESFFLPDGRPGHRLTLFQEGQTESQAFDSQGAQEVSLTVNVRNGNATVTAVRDESLQRDLAIANSMEQYNVAQTATNGRTSAVLRTATGEDLPAAPKAWLEWWANFNELYSQGEKPVSYMTSVTGTQPVQVTRVTYHSCFVPGTTVWTQSGALAIEKIRVGEFVLAQNVDTGELAYKPVTATTVGPKLPLVEIHAGDETIRCTCGHLFWLSGVGWQMAKELKAGEWLHTAHGPILIDSVEKKGEAVCHNLIVADFNTYFVTDRALLVHDINVRGPTDAIVPGWAETTGEPATIGP